MTQTMTQTKSKLLHNSEQAAPLGYAVNGSLAGGGPGMLEAPSPGPSPSAQGHEGSQQRLSSPQDPSGHPGSSFSAHVYLGSDSSTLVYLGSVANTPETEPPIQRSPFTNYAAMGIARPPAGKVV